MTRQQKDERNEKRRSQRSSETLKRTLKRDPYQRLLCETPFRKPFSAKDRAAILDLRDSKESLGKELQEKECDIRSLEAQLHRSRNANIELVASTVGHFNKVHGSCVF
jgi:hypothetical protein